jgi:phosphatidylglycerophosphate synthase
MKQGTEQPEGRFQSRKPFEFINYFGKERRFQAWWAEKRTRLVAVVIPPLVRLGLVPDTISYIGIALLAGVVFYFVRDPVSAVCFLAGHVLCDGLDGAYARHTGKASQAGAFTDLVCDQLGMIVVATLAVFHHLVTPLIGTIYIALYLIVVVFGVIINVMGLRCRITVTSKYFLYLVYALWAVHNTNLFPHLMSLFSVIMAVEVLIGYLRLKRGIRMKFDSPRRFTAGDPYTGTLNYVMNVSVPLSVFVLIFLAANWNPIRAVLDRPITAATWERADDLFDPKSGRVVLGLAAREDDLVVISRYRHGGIVMERFHGGTPPVTGVAFLPPHLDLAFSSLPVEGNTLFLADVSTRMVLGIDLQASFQAKNAVVVSLLPLGRLRVRGLAMTTSSGEPMWLAANYLYTRKTYVIDPHQARKKGVLLGLGNVLQSYTNGAFPAALLTWKDYVIEYNRSRFNGLVYAAPLETLLDGEGLLDARVASIKPPDPNALGPVALHGKLLMSDPQGQLYALRLGALIPGAGGMD